MDFFGSMADKAGKGLDWGKSQVTDAWSAAGDKVEKGKNWTVDKAEQFKDWSVDKAERSADWAVEKVGQAEDWKDQKVAQASDWANDKAHQAKDAARNKLHETVREQAAIAVRNKDLLNSIDRRKDFTNKTTQNCDPSSGPPVPYDGYYLGKDCMHPTAVKPSKGGGHKPHKCGNCGKDFPQVTFTNGIDNTLHDVCQTLQQLADELCVEVIGVYNASYKDATPPPRSAEENMALLKAGATGARDGAIEGLKDGIPDAVVAGAATGGGGALLSLGKGMGEGALKGAAIGAGKEGLKQQASRWAPSSQDALDVIDTLSGRSQQRATTRMADDIANQLRDGQKVNLIGHSEGGVNTVAAIAQAKAILVDEKKDAIRTAIPDINPEVARMRASQEVEADMAKNMNVTLLGTQQTGLPDGPNYTRIANKSDLVPDAISGAQDAIGRPGHDKEPHSNGARSPAVERFPLTTAGGKKIGLETINPATAHSMKDSYIPYMREKTGRAKDELCC